MEDPERNLILRAWLAVVDLGDCWSNDGPTPRGQLLAHRRRLETLDQEIALHLAFAAWGRIGPKAPQAHELLQLQAPATDALPVLIHRWQGRAPRRR